MPDLIGSFIGLASITAIGILFRYAEALENGNIEKEKNQ